MSHRLGPRLVAALVPAVVVLAVPGVAHADRSTTQDAVGDVVRTVFEDQEIEQAPVAAPDETAVDVVSTAVTHHAARLRVNVRFRDLRPTANHVTYVKVRTPEGTYEVYVERRSGKDTVGFSGPPGTRDCGVRWAATNAADRVTVSLPTSCLGSPRWVQVGVGAASPESVVGGSAAEDGPYAADDAHRTGAVGNSIRLGPRVRRG